MSPMCRLSTPQIRLAGTQYRNCTMAPLNSMLSAVKMLEACTLLDSKVVPPPGRQKRRGVLSPGVELTTSNQPGHSQQAETWPKSSDQGAYKSINN